VKNTFWGEKLGKMEWEKCIWEKLVRKNLSPTILTEPQHSFIGAPKKWVFFKGVMNIIDVLSILPYFISVFLIEYSPGKNLKESKMLFYKF